MGPALVVVVYTIVSTLVAHALVDRWRRAASISPRAPVWARAVFVSLAIGAVLHGAHFLLLPESVVWGLGAFAIALHSFQMGRGLVTSFRFFRDLDGACLSSDPTKIETLLQLGKPPFQPKAHDAWAGRILVAVRRAYELERVEYADRWLSAIDPRRLRSEHGLLVLQLRATLALARGDRAAADAALGLTPNPLPPAFGPPFAFLHALSRAIAGDAPDAALEAARAARAKATSNTDRGWAAVEAHLLVARGEEAAAREILVELRACGGDLALRRLAAHKGPASMLAASLLADTPYR